MEISDCEGLFRVIDTARVKAHHLVAVRPFGFMRETQNVTSLVQWDMRVAIPWLLVTAFGAPSTLSELDNPVTGFEVPKSGQITVGYDGIVIVSVIEATSVNVVQVGRP